MKKIVLIATFLITLTLTGCDFETTETYTKEELEAMIQELQQEQETVIDFTVEGLEDAVTDMIEESRNGVLGLVVQSEYSGGTGSGVIYKREGNTYYMVTNDHVLIHDDGLGNRYQPESITVVYERNGLLFEIANEYIELLGTDPTTDLGVIRFTSNVEFSVIPLGDSYDIEPGQFVFAVGNPLGFTYYGTVTMGVISGTARYYQDGLFDATLMQHDAAISPGNSGGALLNVNGELIGINNMKLVDDYVSNIGFAIPSNTVKRITADLEDDGIITRPYLGVSTYAQVNACGLDYGVCVAVAPGGAAANAGLIDDDIIVGYKNEGMDEYLPVFNFNDLKEAILNSSVGETIQLQFYRDLNNDGIYTEDELLDSLLTTLNVHPDDQN